MSIFSLFTSPKISVLRLSGVIGDYGKTNGLSLNSMNQYIEEAFSFKGLKAVLLIINSPGGSPTQSYLLASRIINLSEQKSIPVYSFIEDVGASGGYWLACAGEKIFCCKSSIVGSIGVVSASFGFQETIKKLGIERRIYTQGKNKCVLDKFSPENEKGVEMIHSIQKRIHAHFIEYVKSRRKNLAYRNDTSQETLLDKVFDGSFWTGEDAKDIGLVDDIDDFHSFVEKNFPKNISLKYIKRKENWIKKKLGIESGLLSYLADSLLYKNKL